MRHDQEWSDASKAQSSNVRIYAPKWIEVGVNLINEKIQNPETKFEVGNDGDLTHIQPQLDLIGLHRITLNEKRNTRGPV